MIGKLTKDYCNKVELLVSSINGKFNPKKISIYYNSIKVYVYERKDVNKDGNLDAKLISLSQSNDQRTSPTDDEISKAKINISSIYKNKKLLTIYNKNGNDHPPSSFNDFNRFIDYLNEDASKK